MALIESTSQEVGRLPLEVEVESRSVGEWVKGLSKLFKLRIVMLLLFSSFGGAALGIIGGGEAGDGRLLLLALTGTLSAAGASAINQYLEIDRDRQMERTANRPLVVGMIKKPINLFYSAAGMILGATLLALLAGLPALAFWLLAGAVIYVAIYTIWLKPRTVLNIVIGGAAGSCAVVAGGAAVNAQWDPAVWILAGIVFAWTPVHFWALALAYRDDYRRAAYPMLPAVFSGETTARWIAFHTGLTATLTVALAFWPRFDRLMVAITLLLVLPLIYKTAALLVRPKRAQAFALFHTSNLFLTAVLTVAMLSLIWRI